MLHSVVLACEFNRTSLYTALTPPPTIFTAPIFFEFCNFCGDLRDVIAN